MPFSDSAESPANAVLRAGTPFFNDRFQAHHIIPTLLFDVTKNLDIATFLSSLSIDQDDSSANRLWLPEKAEDALTLGSPVHNGSHPRYTAFVEARLQEIKDKYDEDLKSVSVATARTSAQADIRSLQSIIPELLQTIDQGTGLPLLTINNPDPRYVGQQAGAINDAAITGPRCLRTHRR